METRSSRSRSRSPAPKPLRSRSRSPLQDLKEKSTISLMQQIHQSYEQACEKRTRQRKILMGRRFRYQEKELEVVLYMDTHYGPTSLIPDSLHLVIQNGSEQKLLAMANEEAKDVLEQVIYGQVVVSFKGNTHVLWFDKKRQKHDEGETAQHMFSLLETFFLPWVSSEFVKEV